MGVYENKNYMRMGVRGDLEFWLCNWQRHCQLADEFVVDKTKRYIVVLATA